MREYQQQLYEINLVENPVLNYKAGDVYKSFKNVGTRFRRKFTVIVTDDLPDFVLGMTDAKGTIWIRRLYWRIKEHVLRHEILHNLFPYLSERAIEALNTSGYIRNLASFIIFYR